MTKQFLKPDQDFSQDLSLGALNFTTSFPNKPFALTQIYIYSDVALSETLSIYLVRSGVSYWIRDLILVSETGYVFRPQGKAEYKAGEQIKVQLTNNGGLGDITGFVRAKEI